MSNSRECWHTTGQRTVSNRYSVMVESVSKLPLRDFVGTLSIEQVEHVIWDMVFCKNNREKGSEWQSFLTSQMSPSSEENLEFSVFLPPPSPPLSDCG